MKTGTFTLTIERDGLEIEVQATATEVQPAEPAVGIWEAQIEIDDTAESFADTQVYTLTEEEKTRAIRSLTTTKEN